MKGKFLFILLAVMMIFALISCQPKTVTEPTAVATEEAGTTPTEEVVVEAIEAISTEPVIITFWMMGGEDQIAYMDKWLKVFNEQYPNITVEYKILDWTNGPAQVLTAFAGGIGPDVFVTYSNGIPRWVENGAYQALDGYFNKEDFSAISMELATWKDQLYAIPWNLKIHTYYVRSDYLKEAGIDKVPETWDELVDASKAMTQYDSAGNITRSGLWINVNHPYKTISQFQVLMMSAGGTYFSEDGCNSTFNGPPGIEAAQLIDDLLNVYKVDAPGAITIDAVDFAQGKVASLFSNLATRGLVANYPDVVPYVEIVAPPHKGDNKGIGQTGGNYMGISPTTKHFNEALALVKFLTMDPRPLYDYALTEGGAIAYKPAMTDEYYAIDPFVERWNALIENNGAGEPKHPNWAEISNEITVALDKIYLEGVDPKEALNTAAVNVDLLLERYGCAQ